MTIFFYCILISGIITVVQGQDGLQVQQKLRKEILANYDPTYAPDNITVNVQFNLIYMDIIEAKSLLILHGWLVFNWDDSRLHWDDEKYKPLNVLKVPQNEVWVPHVTLLNNADENTEDVRQEHMVLVYNRGVLWVPRSVFQIHCNLDLRFWPFDAQTCKFSVGGRGLNFIINEQNQEMALSDYTENPGWTLRHTSFKVKLDPDCCFDRNGTVESWVHIHRNSSGLAATMVMPALALVALILINFWIPPRAMWRICLSLVSTLLSALYLQHLVKLHPHSGNRMPLLVQFFRDSLALVLIFIILTVVCRQLDDAYEGKSPPWVYRLTNGWFGRMLCISQQAQEPRSDIEDTGHLIAPAQEQQHTWSSLTLLLDRVFFYIFSLFFAVYLLTFTFGFL